MAAGLFRLLRPGLIELDKYECHVGLDYMRILSEVAGLRTDALIFVPRGSQTEIRRVTITNISNRALNVDVIPLVEFSHPDALNQLTNADWTPQTMQCRAQKDGEFTILLEYPFMTRDTRVNYLTSNLPSLFFRDWTASNSWAPMNTARLPTRSACTRAELANHQANRGDIVAHCCILWAKFSRVKAAR